MVVVRTSCPTCGDVRLAEHEVRAWQRTGERRGAIMFECPHCRRPRVQQIGALGLLLLERRGVPVARWDFPLELEELHEGPQFTVGDLARFRELLDTPGWFDRLVQ